MELIIGPNERAAIAALIVKAEASPVDMRVLMKAIETKLGKAKHMQQMTDQSIYLPTAFCATYSMEIGHPGGRCRHLSVSITEGNAFPDRAILTWLAREFGFRGGLEACMLYVENLTQGMAINLVQPVPS